MIVTLPSNNVGILLCYANPVYEEEEQELPFMRWNRYYHQVKGERYIQNMTLVRISAAAPEVFHGSVHCITGAGGERKLWFRELSGNKTAFTFNEVLNQSIENQFQCQGQINCIPTWNGREVVLGRVSILDHEDDVPGNIFVKEWVGVLCASFFHVTKAFMSKVCKSPVQEKETVSSASAQKSPKANQNLFWIWWPPMKPRNLAVFLQESEKMETVCMNYFKHNSPIISGIYRVTFAEVESNGDISWVMKVHADREASVPVFFDPDTVATGEEQPAEYESGSKDVRVIFNRNFALKHGRTEGINLYGMFGSLSYVTAQLLPYRKDNLCPMLPCLSPWGSLFDFKEKMSQRNEIPEVIDSILLRASSIRTSLGKVLATIPNEDLDYFRT